MPWLTDPAAHGIGGPGFDVVIPSLPGYNFSGRPARTGVSCRYTAGLWHRLMRGLGYRRYGAQGGDFGSAVTTFMALDDPAPVLGIHLSNLDIAPIPGRGRGRCRRPNTPTWRSTSDGGTMTAATARSSRRGPRQPATGSTTHQPAWLPGSGEVAGMGGLNWVHVAG